MEQNKQEKPFQGKKILMVDDEAVILECFRSILEPAGATIQTAEDGYEALEMLKTKTFDLITSNINMPRVNGFELLKEIKARSITTPIIIISGYTALDAIFEVSVPKIFFMIPADVNFFGFPTKK